MNADTPLHPESPAGSGADPTGLAEPLLAGDRRALARAITLIESTRADHRAQADALLARLLPHAGRSVRVGITGVPGVGKSTFIEAFGLHVIGRGHKVAVLAIDPSSQRTGGSILGDKTRMEQLSRDPAAFIRPSPAGSTLGGVARRTREAMLLCEAAGFDVIVVETVGVGQSETAVADMVDLFLLLLLPAGGDELQGLKKGIVELADLVVVNKADGDLVAQARHAVAEYRHALALLRPATPDWTVPVLSCSAITGTGVDGVWGTIGRFRDTQAASGRLDGRRADQARAWMWNEIRESLLAAFTSDPAVRAQLGGAESAVTAGTQTPAMAARSLLARFRHEE
ncbi:methylmalonyl Co-A mutase-associated GTPase MeaB [Nitrospirillum viridazoti]|uniref:Methylmalonyl-CoA mutase metallochaperone MeaB n=1 Tax=Nitrospirillum amazonense TaxID=28077 RepID=A0A560HVM0_9PROT|nr:methylmalonyl Co-A mutase-associated GTPase MeaB [Nitrospirillum amazonense]TWB49579.1 methylmalonyl-CoA mutase metallochaperone MeaB [Nitrospirillum amazonense]